MAEEEVLDEQTGTPAVSLTGLVLLLLLGVVGYQLFLVCQSKQVEYEAKLDEVAQARRDNVRLEQNNRRLQALTEYLKTNEGVEEIARDKLGLVRPGEVAFVVVPPPPARAAFKMPEVEEPPAEDRGLIQTLLHNVFAPR